jgi:hypothetical protein
MPVQIHEVVIRATVTERQPACGDTPAASGAAATPASGSGSSELIAEQIFEILKAKRER